MKKKCKYYKQCKYADMHSVTCTKSGGGNYCGVYRIFEKKNEINL